ncbi:conserved hypothetical protein [Burkholderiales bacterium]|nr:conserved hypothetical protein [Burkholderiales bacterium]
MMNPEAVAQRRLDAYNARDLRAFLAMYSENIRVFRPPNVEPVIVGKTAFGDFYAKNRFNRQGLHAELLNRMVLGNRVIDHERISGVRDQPFEVAIVYEVAGGLIQCTWFYATE